MGSVDFSGSLQGRNASSGRFSANFPVFFPVTGKFDAETGSIWAASPANNLATP
jgi:hypothetical protein